jgi:RNA polymerase sigma factor (sigma-70 family)
MSQETAGDLETLVRAAVRNDGRAWDRLVAEFTPVIRRVARRHRLSSFDEDDVVQRTWMALVRHIVHLYEPSSLGAWLATTARREALRVIREAGREIPSEEACDARWASPVPDEDGWTQSERREAVRRAAEGMSPRQRALVSALTIEPPLSYAEVSERLGIPVGSIGPTRRRCLERLRRDPRVSQLLDEDAGAHRPVRAARPALQLA